MQTYESWKDVKPKVVKERLIKEYILTLKEKYNLSLDECRECMKVINTGILLKIINNEDIVFSNSKIHHISSIIFNKDTRKFSLKGTIESKRKPSVNAVKDNPIVKELEKYVEKHKTIVTDCVK